MTKLYHLAVKAIHSPLFYFSIATVLFIWGMNKKYINIFGIIKNYFYRFIKKSISLILIMFVCPILFSVSINIKYKINNEMINLILVMVSILTTLFFTYLSFFDEKKDANTKNIKNYNLKCQINDYYEETKAVASYEILISVLIMMCCFVYYTKKLSCFVSFIIYFLLFHLLINLLVLLKRYNTNII